MLHPEQEIKVRYADLLKKVENDPFYKKNNDGIHNYACKSCGYITKTKDVDQGVTPFHLRCRNCNGDAYSTGYKDQIPNQPHTFEWYRPSLEEVLALKNPNLVEHILSGGLALRPVSNLKTGIDLITAERQKQIDKYGFTAQHHLSHPESYDNYQLQFAAATLLMHEFEEQIDVIGNVPDGWDQEWFCRMNAHKRKERLIIAAALIAAELDTIELHEHLQNQKQGDGNANS